MLLLLGSAFEKKNNNLDLLKLTVDIFLPQTTLSVHQARGYLNDKAGP